jgi:hypothetical protein
MKTLQVEKGQKQKQLRVTKWEISSTISTLELIISYLRFSLVDNLTKQLD